MSWLSRAFGRERSSENRQSHAKPRGSRRTYARRSVEEREREQNLRYLRRLEHKDPARYDAFMARRLGLVDQDVDGIGSLEVALEKLKRMRELVAGDDGGSMIRDVIAGLAAAASPMLVGALQGRPAAPAQPVTEPAATPRPAPAEPPASSPPPAEPPPATAAPSEAPTPAAAPTERVTVGDISPESAFLIQALSGKTPQQAADWLLKQRLPQLREAVQWLVETPDAQLLTRLDQLAEAAPMLKGFAAWIRPHEDWVIQTARIVRAATSSA